MQHAKRTAALGELPAYQPELVRRVTGEVRGLEQEVAAVLAGFAGGFRPAADPAAAVRLLVGHLAMRRNKRCLLAYHRTRAERLEAMCWRGDDVLEAIAGQGEAKSALSPEEEDFVGRFDDLLGAVKGRWSDVDLGGSMQPPRELFVDVRVLRDAGEIQTEYGSITLTKNSQFYVRQGDVERLIQQGYLQKLD